ncbi:hypothetical protein ACFSUS_17240 [Spirosoma soli]|uniref:Uncharacterized protein n=1 Tax=Spirosoma soli TaxID=1770529 RepID=A0ABW5M5V4_9BACT
MKTIRELISSLVFRATNIGAYFAPLFRPMVTEDSRLRPIRVRPDVSEADKRQIVISRSSYKGPTSL